MALVLWIRITPLSLASADDWASEIVPRGGDDSERAKVARELRSQLSFEGEDGREYPYLGDFDSYHWLRLAATTCAKGRPATPWSTASAATPTPARRWDPG